MKFYTSDIHFGHANIIEYCNRPFASVDAMNEAIIDRWNATVTPDDEVYVLGDVALGRIKETLPLVLFLNGHKTLIPGNHDRCWRGHRKAGEKQDHQYYAAGFEQIVHVPVYTWFGTQPVQMSHFPYEGDSHDEDRYVNSRPKADYGNAWLLHGHVHDAWQVKDHQINVGMDVWGFRPVAHDTLQKIIEVR